MTDGRTLAHLGYDWPRSALARAMGTMTLAARIRYCRLRLIDPRTPVQDLAAWLAEHDGLMIEAGWMSELPDPAGAITDARIRLWFDRGREDGQMLRTLEITEEAQKDTGTGK